MMDSHYQVQGDMVMTTITFVPTDQDKEVTCEASNEALSKPIRKTVVIEVDSDISTIQAYSAALDADYEINDNVSDKDPTELTGNYPIHKDATESNDASDFRMSPKDNDAVVSLSALDPEKFNIDIDTTGHYLESEITESGEIHDLRSNTISGQSSKAEDKTLENVGDIKKHNSERPTDAVYVPSQKPLSNTQFIKTSVEVTEATKTNEKDKPQEENNTEPLLARSTMNDTCQHKYSFSSLFFSVILALVART